MPLRVNFKAVIGTIKVRQSRPAEKKGYRDFTIDICQCNALAAFISKYKDEGRMHYELWSFFLDKSSAERCIKNGWITDNHIVACKLNYAYNEAKTLLPLFVKNGVKVSVYYKLTKLV